MGFHLKLSGVTFDNRQRTISKLEIGETLFLVRESNNQYDKNAVLVKTKNDADVGYIPAAYNYDIARNLDSGKIYEVKVSAITGGGIGMNYGINIFLRELS